MKKLHIPIFLLFIFAITLFAQDIKENQQPNSKNKSVKLPNETQVEGDKVSIKDGFTVLLEIENEGNAGSIILPDVNIDPMNDTKLYNRGGSLYWGLNQLGASGSNAIWARSSSNIYPTNINDNVGIRTTNPLSLLSVGGNGSTNYTIFGSNSTDWGTAIYGEVPSGSGFGVIGKALGTGSYINYGGFFSANGKQGIGASGEANSPQGIGIHGKSINGWAGYFEGKAHFSSNVGIGTTSPNATLDVNGDLEVTGAYKGNIGPNNGAPFPRPAYDSGWQLIEPDGDFIILTHNIGGDENDYFVDVTSKSDVNTPINNRGIGGKANAQGFWYSQLSNTQIRVDKESTNYPEIYVRVRIWVYN